MTDKEQSNVVVRWLADRLMPWAARNATVWPSQHATHKVLMESRIVEGFQRARVEKALRDVLAQIRQSRQSSIGGTMIHSPQIKVEHVEHWQYILDTNDQMDRESLEAERQAYEPLPTGDVT